MQVSGTTPSPKRRGCTHILILSISKDNFSKFPGYKKKKKKKKEKDTMI